MDASVRLVGHYAKKDYPETLRLITAVVEVDGKDTVMTFLTNNPDCPDS